MFREEKNESFDVREKRVLQLWKEKNIFSRSVVERKHLPAFTFYDGPPFATGLPHYGHLLAGTIKDVVLRFKTMEGFYAPRRFGWDCHGLPVENEIEKLHQLSGARAIEDFGIAKFNESCRGIVLRYTKEWEQIVERMGRWVDFQDSYRTMDPEFMESVWWVFKELYSKGLVYEGLKVMPFSTKLGTPLSNFEASENYKEVDDPSLTVAFSSEDDPGLLYLAWTTTPWTLISNLALMVGAEVEYVELLDRSSHKRYILAKAKIPTYFKDPESIEILKTFHGSDLEGRRYLPLFPYFAAKKAEGAFRIILEEGVSVDEGTGIVHAAPAFGEVDFYACQRAGIFPVCPVDQNGQFTQEIPEYYGVLVKEADKAIIRHLKEQGKVVQHGTCRHRYPFCPRSETPLIYKAVRTWFVAVEKIKERLLKANDQISWVPAHIKYGRFGKWLEGARDWAISRNRYWGTPIPLWRADDGEIHVIGSLAELKELTGKETTDLHRHFIDELTFVKEGKVFRRIPEVFDCWFESGAMPYAQNHYPFDGKELFEKHFPADFIGEGLDQTRGWFYTLNILSVALFDRPPFKNVIVNGLVLAEDGAKMSKRLKNYPDPMEVVQQFGADAVRLYLLDSAAVKAEDLSFSKAGVELVLRRALLPLWNAYTFFITYARINCWDLSPLPTQLDDPLDRWVISRVEGLLEEVRGAMDQYDLSAAVKPFMGFIDELTNWYIRRSRRRFWSEGKTKDQEQAYATLYTVLMTVVQVAAPFIPFITEAIYNNLRSGDNPESVHLCLLPQPNLNRRDLALEKEMEWVQLATRLGHSLRKEQQLKVRQPLSTAYLISSDPTVLKALHHQTDLITDELNVKEVVLSHEEETFVNLSAKPNFRVLGKKVGKEMPQVQNAIAGLTHAQRALLLSGKSIDLVVNGITWNLTPEEIQVERTVRPGVIAATSGSLTIALNTELTPSLLDEGLAREMINKINTMRRDSGLAVTDRIRLVFDTTERVRKVFEQYHEWISGEVLAVEVEFSKTTDGIEWDLNGEPARLSLEIVPCKK